ncbi:MAG: sigma 54-interacting transcriptional regulator [Myxococcota bacterium]
MTDSNRHSETMSVPAAALRARVGPSARLVVVHPPELAQTIALAAAEVVLGRHPGAGQAELGHGSVSRTHLAVSWDAQIRQHVAADLESRNGSWVGGVALAGARRALDDGDVLRLGGVVAVYERGPFEDDAPAPGSVLATALPGTAAAVQRLRKLVRQAGADPSPALVIGETGVGKELLARALHTLSGRQGPLVAVNVAEFSPELIASQLFGHERGAFTGADRAAPGLFRAAHHGTLFLDEIGELPLALQPKLLRALQEGEVRPVGATRSVKVDVRVVAATNRDLAADVESERFRRDLYARLALWELRVPPVRARRVDILAWLAIFVARWRESRPTAGLRALSFDAEAVERLLLHAWPDNLRGLDRLVHRLAADHPAPAVLSLAAIAAHVPAPAAPAPATTAPPAPAPRLPAPTTPAELQAALDAHAGSVRALARHYGRDRRQIYRWLDTFGLRGDE